MANEVSVDIAIETKKARQSIEKLEKSFSGFASTASKETSKATNAIEVFQGVIGANIIQSAFIGIKDAVIGFGASSVQSAAQIEGLTSQLTTLTGSAGDARSILGDLQEFSARTPFQLPGITEATKKLLSFGFAQDELIPKLQEIGDVAAGSGAGFEELTLIYGQVNAAGKLTGERLLQLQERAIPIGPALARTLGVAETAVKDLVSAGKVDFATFEKAFSSLNQEGGKFFEGMIRQSKTFDGVMSTLGDNVNLLTADFGQGLLPTFKTLGIAFISLIQNNKDLASEFGKVADTKLNELIDDLIASIIPLGNGVVFLNDVFVGLASTWDFIKLGLNELVGLFISGTETILETARATREFLGLDTSPLDESIAQLTLLKEANREVTQEINDGIDARLESQQKFKEDVSQVTAQVTASTKKEIDLAREKTKVIEEETSKQKEIQAGAVSLSEQEQVNAKVIELEKAKSQKIIDTKAAEIVALNEMKLEESEREEEERLIKIELEDGQADERLQLLSDRLGKEEAIRSEAEARRLDKEGKVAQAKKKRRAADVKAEKEDIFAIQKFEDQTQKQRLTNIQSTLGTISSLSESNNKSLAAAGKAAAISTATIDGFAAVQKALASAPPPFNFAIAGLVGAATAANIAKIASVKGFQGGGVVGGVPQDRDNQTVNVASGEVILNRRQQAETLFQIANGQNSGGGGGLSINIEAGIGGVSDEQVDNLINQINDRTEFGNQSLRSA